MPSEAPNLGDTFSLLEGMTSNRWPETVYALSAHIHTNATEGKESLYLFCYNDDKLSPADRLSRIKQIQEQWAEMAGRGPLFIENQLLLYPELALLT